MGIKNFKKLLPLSERLHSRSLPPTPAPGAWDFLTNQSKLDLFPKDLTWDAALPAPQHAIPGKTKLI